MRQQFLHLYTWTERHSRAVRRGALIVADVAGALALATLTPQATVTIIADFGTEVFTRPTYGLMALACVAYAFLLATLRRWQSAIYERLLYAVVIGGVIIVGMSAWWRVTSFPVPAWEAREVAQWALRIVAYHFTAAALPMVLWQFGQEQAELRRARAR